MLLVESLLGSSSAAANYIEDVFSTYLYTGNGSTQTITNGIDLSGKGGLVWIKDRGTTGQNHNLVDTVRGATKELNTNSTSAQVTNIYGITSFNANGWSMNTAYDSGYNGPNYNYASWTFRKQAKFFDVVTYTGNGLNSRQLSHNLGSVPGCVIIKRTDNTSDWSVYHRSLRGGVLPWLSVLYLNLTAAQAADGAWMFDADPTATTLSLRGNTSVNANGGTYVAYLFAHDAGGFGATGSDNVISCGSFTTDGSSKATVNLGYEPQYVMVKRTNSTGDWWVFDVMRGLSLSTDSILKPNTTEADAEGYNFINPTSTGFTIDFSLLGFTNSPFIYIAIRRGPMKTPTVGTSVFGLNARTGTGANATVTGGQTDDAVLIKNRGSAVASLFSSRLTGTGYLVTSSTAAEVAAGTTILQANPWDVMDGVKLGTTSTITNASANTFINYLFRRAPGFFDVVCYTGDGTGFPQFITSNIGSFPQLVIVKNRTSASAWWAYHSALPISPVQNVFLNTNGAATTTNAGVYVNPNGSSSGFSVINAANASSNNYVAYLFATVAGVSKVGSYTGTGTTKQIDCGFTGGTRFVLIKRTDSTGDWYVWDTARGIVAGNDPYLLLNSTAAEVTTTDYVDTYSAGFELSSTAPAALNANGGTYIFLAIA